MSKNIFSKVHYLLIKKWFKNTTKIKISNLNEINSGVFYCNILQSIVSSKNDKIQDYAMRTPAIFVAPL